jgi:MCRA family
VTFTVTTTRAEFFEQMTAGSDRGSGGLVSLKDSSWLVTLTIFHQPEVIPQPPGTRPPLHSPVRLRRRACGDMGFGHRDVLASGVPSGIISQNLLARNGQHKTKRRSLFNAPSRCSDAKVSCFLDEDVGVTGGPSSASASAALIRQRRARYCMVSRVVSFPILAKRSQASARSL